MLQTWKLLDSYIYTLGSFILINFCVSLSLMFPFNFDICAPVLEDVIILYTNHSNSSAFLFQTANRFGIMCCMHGRTFLSNAPRHIDWNRLYFIFTQCINFWSWRTDDVRYDNVRAMFRQNNYRTKRLNAVTKFGFFTSLSE